MRDENASILRSLFRTFRVDSILWLTYEKPIIIKFFFSPSNRLDFLILHHLLRMRFVLPYISKWLHEYRIVIFFSFKFFFSFLNQNALTLMLCSEPLFDPSFFKSSKAFSFSMSSSSKTFFWISSFGMANVLSENPRSTSCFQSTSIRSTSF